MSTRVGRTIVTSAVRVPGVSASGYDAGDAIGSSFEIPLALGDPGGLLGSLELTDAGSGTGTLRLHLWSDVPSAQVNGAAFAHAPADINKYLGCVTVSGNVWSSGTLFKGQILDQPLPLYAPLSSRVIYGQLQNVGSTFFSAYSGSGMFAQLGVLQD